MQTIKFKSIEFLKKSERKKSTPSGECKDNWKNYRFIIVVREENQKFFPKWSIHYAKKDSMFKERIFKSGRKISSLIETIKNKSLKKKILRKFIF